MSKVNIPKFKVYSSLGIKLTDHPKLTSQKLRSKKWRLLFSPNRRPRKETEYGLMLQAKQKLRTFYGCTSDKQFTNTFIKAGYYKGNQIINFIKLMERRLDVILLRSKISPSVVEIRQFIQHGHFSLNNSLIKTPSLLLNKNDFIKVNPQSIDLIKNKVSDYYLNLINNNKISTKLTLNQIINKQPILFIPNYLEFNHDLMEGKLINTPDVENICYSFNPDLTSLMDYYKYKLKIN
jgi:small subunit ribosomal protein S4